jgi:tRNA(Leu) C34 or U34 (ribose-2'-O)-methylase TrmL
MNAVILINPKYPHNVAGAIRACSCFGVSDLVWTGKRVDPAQYSRLPREERMKGYSDVHWQMSEKPVDLFPSYTPVCVELLENAESLTTFEHPENAVYIFGPEDGHVPQSIRCLCHRFIVIPSNHCLNLTAAMNVVLYDRRAKRQLQGLETSDMSCILKETRGMIETPGWEGK